MNQLQVADFDGEAADWDAAVRSYPGWTHFHLYRWRKILHEVFGHQSIYLVARDGSGSIHGVLPLVRVRSALFGRYLVSMPFLNYGGPLGDDEAIRQLTDEAIRRGRAERVKLLELRSRTSLPVSMEPSHRKVTMLLDLPAGDPDLLWKRFDAKLRSQIRRPRKEGVTTRFGADQVGPFFKVFAHHMRDLGTPVMPRRFFESIVNHFADDISIGVAYFGEQPVAAGFGFRWRDELEMTWASSLLEFKRLAPNMLLYWSFMESAIAEGVRVFNFGRCTPGSGTHRFKQQWGTREEQLWWYGVATRPGTTTPAPNDNRYAWGPRIWRHLPARVATALGPSIVRGIP